MQHYEETGVIEQSSGTIYPVGSKFLEPDEEIPTTHSGYIEQDDPSNAENESAEGGGAQGTMYTGSTAQLNP